MTDLMILGEMARRPKPMLKRAKMDIHSIIWLTTKGRRIRRFGNRNEFWKTQDIIISKLLFSHYGIYGNATRSKKIYPFPYTIYKRSIKCERGKKKKKNAIQYSP